MLTVEGERREWSRAADWPTFASSQPLLTVQIIISSLKAAMPGFLTSTMYSIAGAAARASAIASSSSSASSASSAAARRLFTTSPTSPASWGGGKLKTHQGTAKRFRAISKPKPRYDDNPASINARLSTFAAQNGGSGTAGMSEVDYALAVQQMATAGRGEMRPGPLFKRGKTGKRHLNLQLNGSRLNGLGGTAVAGKGRNGWHLRKLLAPII